MLIDMHLRVNSIADSHFVKIVQVFKKYIGNVPISWSLVRKKKTTGNKMNFTFQCQQILGRPPSTRPTFTFVWYKSGKLGVGHATDRNCLNHLMGKDN